MSFARAARDIFDRLAEPVSYTPAGGAAVEVPAGGIVNPDLQRSSGGLDAQLIGTSTRIALLSEDIKSLGLEPKRGDQITIEDGTAYRVESPLSNDGFFVVLTVK